MRSKPRLLILSTVYPFPRDAGQQQRVYYTIRALREYFHVTFLTVAEKNQIEDVRQKLLEVCDETLVLPSNYNQNVITRIFHKIVGAIYAWITGLKFSNYVTGKVEFSPVRIASALETATFDLVLYEYWHAYRSVDFFRRQNIPAVLDMHDILWRSYSRQLDAKKVPVWLKNHFIQKYKKREESAWNKFDMLIAINQDEFQYVKKTVRSEIKLFYAPMGTDISLWDYCWQPATPKRIAYYGSLGSAHNQQDALLCQREIMPLIWEQYPDTEYWIVGSHPPAFLKELERDPRIQVTGFVEHPQDVLKTMSLVLCPWSGTYGFRSRVVEVMALGVPVIASEDAVYGMGFDVNCGIFLTDSPKAMAAKAIRLLQDEKEIQRQSKLARKQIEEKFSYAATYEKLSLDLAKTIGKMT